MKSRSIQHRVSRSLTPPVRSLNSSSPSCGSFDPTRRRTLFPSDGGYSRCWLSRRKIFPLTDERVIDAGDEIESRVRGEEEKWGAIIVRRTKQIRGPTIARREVSDAPDRKSVDSFDRHSVNEEVLEAGTTYILVYLWLSLTLADRVMMKFQRSAHVYILRSNTVFVLKCISCKCTINCFSFRNDE